MKQPAQTDGQTASEALVNGAIAVRAADPGVLRLSGDDAAAFLQGQLTNDIEALQPGSGAYAALLTPKGKMRADMRVLRTADALLVLTSAGSLPTVRETIVSFKVGFEFDVVDATGRTALLSLVGPRSHELATLVAAAPGEQENDHARGGDLLAITTLLGADLIGSPDAIDSAQPKLAEAGATAAGLAELELARIEAGIPAFGQEMTEQTIPEEAGINERAVSFTKGCYVGQETVARLHYKGTPNRLLRGLELDEPVAPGVAVIAGDGKELGAVGGAAVSPRRGPIALAVLRREAQPGDTVFADGIAARVTAPGISANSA